MKKIALFALLFCLLAPAVAKDKTIHLTGWVTDYKCATKSATAAIAPEHAGCARKCSAENGSLALVTDSDHRVVAIENGFMVRGLEGQLVDINALPGSGSDSVKVTSVIQKQK